MMKFSTFVSGITVGVAAFVGAAVALVTRRKRDRFTALLERNFSKDSGIKVEGLYWRPYMGPPMPSDAVLAGVTRREDGDVNVYIGQVTLDENSAAGNQAVAIYADSDYVTTTYDGVTLTRLYVRILCGKKKVVQRKIRWISSEDQDDFEPDEDFVRVGHELNRATSEQMNLFIGRTHYEGTFLVGKVFNCAGLRFCPYHNNKELIIESGFEVLAYNK